MTFCGGLYTIAFRSCNTDVGGNARPVFLLFLSPIELKHLEDLLHLRVPLKSAPEIIDDIVKRPLPKSMQEALKRSAPIDVQWPRDTMTENALMKTPVTTDAILIDNNPSLVDFDPYSLDVKNVSLSSSSSPRNFLWYQDTQLLASCQLMYRSMLGFYVARAQHLCIDKSVPRKKSRYLKRTLPFTALYVCGLEMLFRAF